MASSPPFIDKLKLIFQTSYLTGLEIIMHTWAVQDAKARFSEFLEACLTDGPQLVTKRGAEAAVLIPVQEWRRMREAVRPTLKALLLSDDARAEFQLPARGQAKRRTPQAFR